MSEREPTPDSGLDRIATAVGDRTPLEWDEVLAGHPRLAETLENLRAIDAIASA